MSNKHINQEQGIVLCATGDSKYYTLCNTLIRDIREVMNNVTIAVYTDSPELIYGADVFLDGIFQKEKPFLSKIKACQNSPFLKTIYLDVDTRLLHAITELFTIINHFDIAACFATGRKFMQDPDLHGISISTSTLVFKNTSKIHSVFLKWEALYLENSLFPGRGDQKYLSHLIYHNHAIRMMVLPSEYTFNTDYPAAICGTVKCVTSLVSDIDSTGEIDRGTLDSLINRLNSPRVVYFNYLNTKRGKFWKKTLQHVNKLLFISTIEKNKILLRIKNR